MAVLASRGKELRLRRVARVGRVVVIRLVAPNANSRQRRVIVVDMAIGALARWNGVRSGQRERCIVVVEGRVGPRVGVVTQLALLRKPG